MKTIVAVHTTTSMVEPTKELFAKHLSGVRLIHIADDSLINDIIMTGKVSADVEKRLMRYYETAENAGADIIFNTCSSVGDVALMAQKSFKIPIVKIDDAMAMEAVKNYTKIGVMATLQTTMGPTIKLLQHFSESEGKNIKIVEHVAKRAFEAMTLGDKEFHDQLIIDAAVKLKDQVDVILLAQGSMARMEKQLTKITGKPVLSSPERGILNLKQMINQKR